VRAACGGQCGKYLAASMRLQLDGLERHGELVDGHDRYSPSVREEPAMRWKPSRGSLKAIRSRTAGRP
jgi:hypothetical protein